MNLLVLRQRYRGNEKDTDNSPNSWFHPVTLNPFIAANFRLSRQNPYHGPSEDPQEIEGFPLETLIRRQDVQV
jgi:hypothetical protein